MTPRVPSPPRLARVLVAQAWRTCAALRAFLLAYAGPANTYPEEQLLAMMIADLVLTAIPYLGKTVLYVSTAHEILRMDLDALHIVREAKRGKRLGEIHVGRAQRRETPQAPPP